MALAIRIVVYLTDNKCICARPRLGAQETGLADFPADSAGTIHDIDA